MRSVFSFLDCWSMLTGGSHVDAQKLHDEYGSVVRISPNALSFNTSQAWKGMQRSTVNASHAKRHDVDIYGSRVGKGQLEKDPIIFQRDPANNILGNTYAQTHRAIRADERSCKQR